MEKQLKLWIKTITLFILLFFMNDIILDIFNININSLSNNEKYTLYFVLNIVYLIIIFFSYKKTIIENFKSFFKDFANNFEIAFKYWLIGFLIMVISNFIIIYITKSGLAGNEQTVRESIKTAPLYMIFSVVIYAPITEELLFRRSFKDLFKNKYIYILVSGIVFGGLHVISYVQTYKDLVYLIPYCSLGIAFSYTYYKTNNIFSTISMHLMHNSIAIILYLLGSAI